MHAQYANSVTQTFGHYMDNKETNVFIIKKR